MNKKTDILVIGAGIVGISIAYFLAEKGRQVIVLEKDKLGSGASGGNLGQLSLIDRQPDLQLRWAFESMEIYKDLIKNEGFDIELNQSGGLMVLNTEAQRQKALELIEQQKKKGLDVSYLSSDEIKSKEPLFENPRVVGGAYCPDEGSVEPLKATIGFAEKAKQKGVDVLTDVEVTGFSEVRGEIKKVYTSQGDIEADIIVLATGSWTHELARKIGLDVPVYYHRGTAMVTSPIPKCINNVIVSGGFLTPRPMQERIIGLAIAQHINGSIIIGQATEESKDYSRDITVEGVKGVAENFLQYFPSLNQLDIVRTWACNTTYTKDGLPVYGFSTKVKNVFFAAGLKGAFSTAPAAGRMAAEIICSGKNIQQIEGYLPER